MSEILNLNIESVRKFQDLRLNRISYCSDEFIFYDIFEHLNILEEYF
jgi:hypothetical protein